MAKNIAVVLFNLGGPSDFKSVKPFLFNLFYDKNIISVPNPFRYFLAKLISGKREIIAKEIYEKIGGKSPIFEETEKQAKALEKELNKISSDNYKVFISMRYWHPFSSETIKKVKQYSPDEVILLPLYPQFSTATTASSFADWDKKAQEFFSITKKICCYPSEELFINSHVNSLEKIDIDNNTRILFSAHGLPEKVVKAGDPYQSQVEITVGEIIKKIGRKNLDYVICYQSRVGPLKWIGPATDEEIKRAGTDGKKIVVVPIAFVSEHSETLVELDIEYKKLAEDSGVKDYKRVPTLSEDEFFIKSLANICLNYGEPGSIKPAFSNRICAKRFIKCPC